MSLGAGVKPLGGAAAPTSARCTALETASVVYRAGVSTLGS